MIRLTAAAAAALAVLLAACSPAARDAERQMRSIACTVAMAHQNHLRQVVADSDPVRTDDLVDLDDAGRRVREECLPDGP